MTEPLLVHGDCRAVMVTMDACSADAMVTDPPYGLEFMGKDWDRLDTGDAWRAGGGMTAPGIGDRDIPWPSFGGGDAANASCATCGGRMRGVRRCACAEPDWRVKGEPLLEANQHSAARSGQAQQEWHHSWAVEAYRVLKPGGHLVAFGGSRTSHRLACALEDAGFEIRDTLSWMYGSGFPKSLDVGKAIDRAAGAERTEALGPKPGHEDFVDRTDDHSAGGRSDGWDRPWRDDPDAVQASHQRYAPATPEAEQWDGWGTALKPAWEPIILARKPIEGTVAANVLAHGTGGLNVDGCRVGYRSPDDEASATPQGLVTGKPGALAGGSENGADRVEFERSEPSGRWPANVVLSHDEDCVLLGARSVRGQVGGFTEGSTGTMGSTTGRYGAAAGETRRDRTAAGPVDEHGVETIEAYACTPGCPVGLLDAQTGVLRSGDPAVRRRSGSDEDGNTGPAFGAESRPSGAQMVGYGDEGGASRFFYCPKTSRAERNAGLGAPNHHPTVKPVELMRWLVRLVTPPNGRVLDPFMGSGSTGIAAVREGVDFVGIERQADYLEIARRRVAWAVATLAEQQALW